MEKFYKKGAEAELTQTTFDNITAINKKRIAKNYRNPKLDFDIRKKRTKAEAKLIKEASKIINTPRILKVNENSFEIIMEYLNGVRVKEIIEEKKELCSLIGKEIKKMHSVGIVHGDLTTSNIIYINNKNSKDSGKIFFIDFGLGYFSKKTEDLATDLVVFKKTFNSTHSSLKKGWELVLEGYAPNEQMIKQMEKIEKRARYH
ncbi:MAG: Kae1-associated serine/threonine protein kinase [Candidatus Diapherotrites archaeon]|jgi:Kae1-associated kinase Bud32|uniref:non-specific serine/threonine protein kinase n=1 Tax=Candidatus Iainarchaeum sp. TaxID=3101447 RepID=A0A7K4BZC8_9ARCH|nr:Kae1-associated serine/threonine protein kinase [Candidatus Diapherotrites archaeon]